MLGRILLVLILGAAIAGTALWATGLLPVIAQEGISSGARESAPPAPAPIPEKKVESKITPKGGDLYPLATRVSRAQDPAQPQKGIAADPIVIPNSQLGLIDKVEVPAQRDGVLMFIGSECRQGENVPKDDQCVNGGKVFRRLKEGDRVEKDQLISLVDDTLAKAEVASKEAKEVAAEKDRLASEKTRDEAYQRYYTQLKLYGQGSGRGAATSEEEVRGAKLAWVRYDYETQSKEQAIVVAKAELNQAKKTAAMHEIRSPVSGVVKTIYKHPGESVKNLESVFQIHNYDRLRVEGAVDVQYARVLQPGMQVFIEPSIRENHRLSFSGHRLDITGVAVSKDPKNPLIVSSSDDGTAMVWDQSSRWPVQVFRHDETPGVAVKAVACTPPGAEANLCLTGDSEGWGRIWPLDGKSDKCLVKLQGQHRGPIHCVAFSPDGKICATGGEDNEIMLWDVASGGLRYRISGHRNWITALHFTPQSQLVSVSRDGTVRVWHLSAGGAEQVGNDIKRADNKVDQLGVSPDGNFLLDEQGREMRFYPLSSRTGVPSALQNPSQTKDFRTLALFSPDSSMVLTTSGDEGVLQLWRLGEARSYEIRQLIPDERSPVTCAAFAPDGSFVVAGIRDRKVYLWPVPPKDDLDRQMKKATITNVEQYRESVESKVRVMAEFPNNVEPRLMAGDLVTVVAYPQK
jgi:WD40 repeat protein